MRATSKEEISAALATADQVIVEGNNELLNYAVTKAFDLGTDVPPRRFSGLIVAAAILIGLVIGGVVALGWLLRPQHAQISPARSTDSAALGSASAAS
jgi:hypothetical protein